MLSLCFSVHISRILHLGGGRILEIYRVSVRDLWVGAARELEINICLCYSELGRRKRF